jgi:hypothetical protein
MLASHQGQGSTKPSVAVRFLQDQNLLLRPAQVSLYGMVTKTENNEQTQVSATLMVVRVVHSCFRIVLEQNVEVTVSRGSG